MKPEASLISSQFPLGFLFCVRKHQPRHVLQPSVQTDAPADLMAAPPPTAPLCSSACPDRTGWSDGHAQGEENW